MNSENVINGAEKNGVDVEIREGLAQMDDEREEIVKMWKHMDQKLESKAKSLNLTAVNHMIKNPQVISLIMGLDQNDAHNDQKAIVTVPRVSRTFLDIDYEPNEDEDDDYLPEQDEDASEIGDDLEILGDACDDALQVVEADTDVAPALHTRSKQQDSSTLEPDNEQLFGDDMLLYSAVDDPDYVEFIRSLNDPSKYEGDALHNRLFVCILEAEDPEYNFLADIDAEDCTEEYEIRKDRATEIPSFERFFQISLFIKFRDEFKENSAVDQENPKLDTKGGVRAETSEVQPENLQPEIILVDATLEDFERIGMRSSTLIGASFQCPPLFTFPELQQLKTQLEKVKKELKFRYFAYALDFR
ncbi:unnamed protein product [Gongylonema pulchrum]|uniref:Reverse transcriptase domain-containing protein n=1 Tax=Gongylonema pulchrum TaxID=637853 RepID=A0A183E1P4_9BILA|nr:unnamed protein product [Gongylonema pulchrum]